MICRAAPFVLSALLLAVLSGSPAGAQEHPNVARGLGSGGGFATAGIDSVNLFNGNLVMSIPLGQSYPVGGGLSYRLTLVYNNNVWDHQTREDVDRTYTEALPGRAANAGLGWMVSLGRLNPPLGNVDTFRNTWMGPDGALHTFYPTLHEGETAVSGVEYTRDGTYLRYRAAAGEIDFPDGTIHKFGGDGLPLQIRDRFGNQVNVTYGTYLWTIRDTVGREHRVYFRHALAGAPAVVDRGEHAAFNDSVATYTFRYSKDDLQDLVVTGCKNTDPLTTNTAILLLTKVTLPDGSAFSMPVSDYHAATDTGTPCRTGMIKGLTLPTLGRVEWDYIQYSFPSGSSPRSFRQSSTGVGKRRLKNASGAIEGEWTYTTALTADANYSQPQELINTMVTPLGDKTESFFSVSMLSSSPAGWTIFDYGLPITRYATDGGSLTRYLSRRVYDCGAGATNCQLRRTGFFAYERDDGPLTGDAMEATRRNQRVLSPRTNHDDVGLLEAVVYSSFDGLGHYRKANLYGNFGAGDTRESWTNYNPGQTYPGGFTPPAASAPWLLHLFTEKRETEAGVSTMSEYCFNASTGFLERMRLLKTGTARGATDVIVKNTVSSDLTGTDGKGHVAWEEHFGGDAGGLSTAALCSVALPGNQYSQRHEYAYGVRKSTRYGTLGGGTFAFKLLDLGIDRNTALPAWSRDVSGGLTTTYEYDAFGRLTSEKPAQDGWTRTTYTRATSASALAQVTTARQTNGGGSTLAESRVLLDAFGRVWQEQERMPDGAWSTRETRYNALGWPVSVSEMGSTTKKTELLEYDPFGRARRIRPPDGSAHDVTASYGGVRTVSRTAKVATAYNPSTGTATETNATITETYDRQGRLVEVAEPNGVLTRYEYDVAHRLKRVCQGASGSSSCGQERRFTYDNRGFLLSEKHPEKGASGNGTVSYLSHTARGQAQRSLDGPHDLTFTYDRAERLVQVRETAGAQWVLKAFTYHGSASGSGPGDYKLGKLVRAERHNYPVLGGVTYTAIVADSYTYGGREGRISRKDTSLTFNGSTNETFTAGFTYNDLGQAATTDYPQCAFAACASTPRTVANVYTNGWLTAVSGYTGTVPGQAAGVGVTYHSNGMPSQIAHSNGVVVSHGVDPNGMARPASISATRSGVTLWDSGAYRYDGSGNLWKMGTAWFEYDALSRVKTGAVFPDPLGGGPQQKQAYAFDNYGNLGSITTQVGTGTPTTRYTPTSSSTNRLTGATGYDAAGNLTSWNGAVYEYDALDQMTRMVNGSEEWLYMYTADDERFWSFKPADGVYSRYDRFTLRGLDGEVLREFANPNYTWTSWQDYVYRDGQLLANYLSNGQRRHFHLDHLGSPRLVTNNAGFQVNYHVYFPFGEEATAFDPSTDRMKFTGHERDLASLSGANPTADDLDYHHARHYGPLVGRYLSFDPIGGSPGHPQSWNRYAYVLGRALTHTDPYGLFAFGLFTVGRTPPPVGMTVYDIGAGETIIVSAKAWRWTTNNPNTGVWGLGSLLVGRSFFDSLTSLEGDPPGSELTPIEWLLSELPIDGSDFGGCVEENRLDWGAVTAYTIGNPIANKLAGGTGRMGFGGLGPHPTSWQHKLGSKLSRAFRHARFSHAGKLAGRASLVPTIFEGFYDIGAIGRCAAVTGGS